MTRRPLRYLTALVAALLPLAGAAVLGAADASAAPAYGYVRLAHLSPDTPAVDVSLTSFRGRDFSKLLSSVAYGTVSDYQRVRAGTYTVSMRSPGDPQTTEPLLTTNVAVTGGKSYTVAGVGPNAQLALRVLDDDLTPPAAGKARVRVIEASASRPVVNVTTAQGTDIAVGARFPSTTPYTEVAARSWDLRVQPANGGAVLARKVDLEPGTVYSFVVLDSKAGALDLAVRSDAAGTSAVPQGAVAAGLGGAAPGAPAAVDGRSGLGLPGLLGLVASLLLGGVAALTLVRRTARRPSPGAAPVLRG